MITDYDTLKASMGQWLNRSLLDDQLNEFVQLAEADFRRTLELISDEVSETLTVTGGVTSFPTDFNGIRSLSVDNNVPLTEITPAQADNYVNLTGKTRFFMVVANEISFIPSFDGDATIVYHRKLQSLSDVNTSNELLISNPDVYLAGCMMQAQAFMRDDQDALKWKQIMDLWKHEVKKNDIRKRWSFSRKVIGQNPQIGALG